MNNTVTKASCLDEVEKPESAVLQSGLDLPGSLPPEHEHGLPQETVPYPIARAMEFCLQNCHISQCIKQAQTVLARESTPAKM